jgi:beta-fructofuranosidase
MALAPEAATADADGCWSGCTRIIGDRPAIYYTGVVGEDDERVESVCRAWGSDDLLEWRKDDANPLIAGPPPQLGSGYHRDPFLWQDADGWHMLLGSGTVEGDRHGLVLRYDSADATSWQYGGVFFEGPRFEHDLDLGEHWECPQLLFDGDRAALVVSAQTPGARLPLMHSVYYLGSVRDGRFVGTLGGRLDHGDVFYAPAFTSDARGRALLWGWAQERVDADRQSTLSHAGALTLPRHAAFEGDRLVTRPVPELDGLRAEPLAGDPTALTFAAEPQMELVAAAEGTSGTAGWTLTTGDGRERLDVVVDLDRDRLEVTVGDGAGVRRFEAALDPGDAHRLRVFVDGSLVEVFADDGGASVTTRAYPTAGAWAQAQLTTGGGAAVEAAAWRAAGDVIVEDTNRKVEAP